MRASWRAVASGVLAAGLFASAAALTACGGDDDGGSGAPGTPTSGEAVIDQDRLQFKPEKLTVTVGQQVTFKNSETAIHAVTINGKNVSGNMKKDTTFLWAAPEAGTFKITCDFHPQMKATITAVEAPDS